VNYSKRNIFQETNEEEKNKVIKADQSGEKVEQGNEVTDKKKWIALVFHIPGYLFTFYFLFNMAIQLLKYPNLPMFVLPYFPCTYFSFFFH